MNGTIHVCVCKLKETNSQIQSLHHVAILYYKHHWLIEQDTHLLKMWVKSNKVHEVSQLVKT